jgi:hypothetical protein
MWFVGGADPEWIAGAIAALPASRHADLWSGVGLACAYAGGADVRDLRGLRLAAGTFYPHLAQGVVFAAGARSRAANPAEHTELACQLLCDLSLREAAAISDKTRHEAQADADPAYEVWRRLIREHFAPQEYKRCTPQAQPCEPQGQGQEQNHEVKHAQRA